MGEDLDGDGAESCGGWVYACSGAQRERYLTEGYQLAGCQCDPDDADPAVQGPSWDYCYGDGDSGSDSGCGKATTYECYLGDVYSLSCGEEELFDDCEGGICQEDGDAAECCCSHTTQACSGEDVYWYDSCGNAEELAESCSDACWHGECVSGTCDLKLQGDERDPNGRCGRLMAHLRHSSADPSGRLHRPSRRRVCAHRSR